VSLDAVLDERATRRVGALTLALLASAVGFFVFVVPRIEWNHRVRVRVGFHDVGGLRPGAAFVVAGRTAGRVEAIVPAPPGRDNLVREGGVIVTLAIDEDVARTIQLPIDIFVSSRGIVSERYLELAPGPRARRADDVARRDGALRDRDELRDGDKLRGSDAATLDRVLQRSLGSMVTIRVFGADLRDDFDHLRAELARLALHFAPTELATLGGNLVELGDELDRLRDTGLGGEAGIASLRTVVTESRDILARLRHTIDELDSGIAVLRARAGAMRALLGTRGADALAKLATLTAGLRGTFARADALLAHVDTIQARLVRGEGSLAKLTGDPEFPEDMKELGKVLKRQPWKLLQTPP
jgi:ABC-type transporter Mla subunit MlaD